jgi:ribonuclease P protein component
MNTFTKQERLSSQLHIDKLMQDGKSFVVAPYRIVWLIASEAKTLPAVLISVPKRNFKRAVDRNYIKRVIRDCYRKNKSILSESAENSTLHFMIIYTVKTKCEYKEMHDKMIIALNKLANKINGKA